MSQVKGSKEAAAVSFQTQKLRPSQNPKLQMIKRISRDENWTHSDWWKFYSLYYFRNIFIFTASLIAGNCLVK